MLANGHGQGTGAASSSAHGMAVIAHGRKNAGSGQGMKCMSQSCAKLLSSALTFLLLHSEQHSHESAHC
jgi:hypothetical protein